MKASELRENSIGELHETLEQLRGELFDLKFKWQAEESPDSSRKRKLRHDIARTLTVIREKQQESEKAETAEK